MLRNRGEIRRYQAHEARKRARGSEKHRETNGGRGGSSAGWERPSCALLQLLHIMRGKPVSSPNPHARGLCLSPQSVSQCGLILLVFYPFGPPGAYSRGLPGLGNRRRTFRFWLCRRAVGAFLRLKARGVGTERGYEHQYRLNTDTQVVLEM